MRLVLFDFDGARRVGVIAPSKDRVLDLTVPLASAGFDCRVCTIVSDYLFRWASLCPCASSSPCLICLRFCDSAHKILFGI